MAEFGFDALNNRLQRETDGEKTDRQTDRQQGAASNGVSQRNGSIILQSCSSRERYKSLSATFMTDEPSRWQTNTKHKIWLIFAR